MVEQEVVKRAPCYWRTCIMGGRCRLEFHIRNGRIVGLTEDKTSPEAEATRRNLLTCPRARNITDYYNHPDRVKFPLKRLGEKGEGKWQQISWEQALDEIADKLMEIKDKYGPEAVVYSKGGAGRQPREYGVRLFNAFGTPNHGVSPDNVCHGPHAHRRHQPHQGADGTGRSGWLRVDLRPLPLLGGVVSLRALGSTPVKQALQGLTRRRRERSPRRTAGSRR